MRFFDTLAQTYWQKQEHRIVPQLESILKGLVSDEKVIDGLVKTLNNTRGDIMVRLTQQIPTLKKTDIILFCYLASQLGHNTICLILDKNPGAVNAQVYRLRNKIAGSDAPDKAEFLAFMNQEDETPEAIEPAGEIQETEQTEETVETEE